MRLLGFSWAAFTSGTVRDAASELLATQRGDGGWAQLDTLGSDAYATGQAVYALHEAGQLRPGGTSERCTLPAAKPAC